MTLIALFALCLGANAGVNPQATYLEDEVEVTKWEDIKGDAPLRVYFTANPSSLDPGSALEWRLRNKTTGTNLTRYEENFEFVFTEAGKTEVALLVRLDGEVVDSVGIEVTINDSHLEVPNAFTPNDDGYNDRFQVKSTTKGIVEFHAYIFNRHGQKLFEWTDWQDREKGGWDGKYNGRPVKDGVYFVYVKARGADGREYNIRRDVNLIRKHNNLTETATDE